MDKKLNPKAKRVSKREYVKLAKEIQKIVAQENAAQNVK